MSRLVGQTSRRKCRWVTKIRVIKVLVTPGLSENWLHWLWAEDQMFGSAKNVWIMKIQYSRFQVIETNPHLEMLITLFVFDILAITL